jgi:hypothetical protein
MRCMACGAEMMLMNVDRDDSMRVLGCEHHTLKCSECQHVKWHLAFIRHNRASPRLPAQAAPPVVPASTTQDARPGLFRRSAAKFNRQMLKIAKVAMGRGQTTSSNFVGAKAKPADQPIGQSTRKRSTSPA